MTIAVVSSQQYFKMLLRAVTMIETFIMVILINGIFNYCINQTVILCKADVVIHYRVISCQKIRLGIVAFTPACFLNLRIFINE